MNFLLIALTMLGLGNAFAFEVNFEESSTCTTREQWVAESAKYQEHLKEHFAKQDIDIEEIFASIAQENKILVEEVEAILKYYSQKGYQVNKKDQEKYRNMISMFQYFGLNYENINAPIFGYYNKVIQYSQVTTYESPCKQYFVPAYNDLRNKALKDYQVFRASLLDWEVWFYKADRSVSIYM